MEGRKICAIVGFVSRGGEGHEQLIRVLWQSRVRGLHAFGMTYIDRHTGDMRTAKYFALESLVADVRRLLPPRLIFHARYSTSGDYRDHANNQPIDVNLGTSLAFNGIISMMTKEQMEEFWGVKLETYNDGEIFLRHVHAGGDPVEFVRTMKGAFAGVWMKSNGLMYALRNTRRPAWSARTDYAVIVASTKDILERAQIAGAEELDARTLYSVTEEGLCYS